MRKPGRPPTYPWRTMKVGDTFKFNRPSLASARSAAYAKGADLGKAFQITKAVTGVVYCKRVR